MTRYLRISGLCFSLVVIVSLLGSAAAFAEKTKVDAVPSSKTVKKAQEIVAPSDLQKAVAPVDVQKVIAPADSEKVLGPTDSEKVIAPVDSGKVIGPLDSEKVVTPPY